MKNDLYFYGIGTACAAAVSASLVFGWAQGTTAAAQATAASSAAEAPAERLIRVVLASPFER
jgi:hypothetical protein